MPNLTSGNLELIKPANGEYQDNWDEPINANFDTIDTHVTAAETEIQEARGGSTTLATRLDVALNPDGSPKATPEITKARISQNSGRLVDLYARLNILDDELRKLRHGTQSIQDGMAIINKSSQYNIPLTGPVGGNNAANFLTAAGAVVTVDGDPTPVYFNVDGYLQICRIDKAIDLTGESNSTKYFYAERNSTGRTVETGTTSGSTGGTNLNEFQDMSAQFLTKKVAQGDILVISSGANADTYIVDSITDEHNLIIKGKFVSTLSGMSYVIKDMFHPNILFESTKTGGKCYIGECNFNGSTVTTVTTYAYKTEFESDWVAIDVSITPTFSQTFNHNLGRMPKEILVYGSISNDDTTYAELLSIADVATDYDVNFDAGTSDATVAPTGAPYMTRSVRCKVNRNSIVLENLRDNVFYKDFSGAIVDAGYIKIIARG